jgi:hypothetical protein
MKKAVLLPLFFAVFAHAQNVYIPDANFKTALVSDPNINTNGDGEIQVSEAAAYTGMVNVSSSNISDLTGIQAFTAATGLDCAYNQLTGINISQNTALTMLSCGYNQLTSLNVSSNTGLTTLDCGENQLTVLNVSALASLSTLGCNNNQLTSLNTSANTALAILVCGYNQISSLNLANNTSLTSIECGHNQLTSLNVGANTALTTISCYNNQLTQLNVFANSALRYLNCQQNQLTGLDVSANPVLKELSCYNNQLTTLNVKNGNNSNFTVFYVYNNPNLSCIQVDNAAFMNANWSNGKDPGAVYSENCSTGVTDADHTSEFISVYPNPSTGVVRLNLLHSPDYTTLTVRDELGNCLISRNCKGETWQEIDLTSQPKGVYFIELGCGDEKVVKKVTVQ